MKQYLQKFWEWYERHYTLNVAIAALLFVWQLIHLYWLGADVIANRLTGKSYFELSGFWQYLIIIVDYTEIPALATTALIYINELRKSIKLKNVLFLVLIASQFLHIFWITDEFVVKHFFYHEPGTGVWPIWLAWIAILIDYLELPVIYDTTKKFLASVYKKSEI